MADRTNTAPRCGQNDLISGKYSEMRNSVFAYILRRTGDKAEAEDLVQDTFTRLLEYREVICAETVRSFIFRIAGNLVVDWYRRHALSLKAQEFFDRCRLASGNNVTEETVRLNEMLRIERECIGKMGMRKSEIYLLYIHKGKTSGEISAMLGLSKRTVENHVFAARKMVRDTFKKAI